MSAPSEKFRKSERLCSKKAIEELFLNGKSFYHFPFQVVWSFSPPGIPSPAQAAISVSKRTFRKAVTRNLIRRRIREAYRKEKHTLYEALDTAGRSVIFILIYKDDKIGTYTDILNSVRGVITRLVSYSSNS